MTTDSAAITVVSGLPRSGTSLMMQMLAAGGMPILTDRLRAPDDDNPRGYFELEAVKRTRQDPSWLSEAPGKAVKVVHALLKDLPPGHQYRVILMQRPLPEVVASQRAMLARSGQEGARLTDEKLAAVFRAQLDDVETWMSRQPHFQVLRVNHRDCLDRAASAAAEVNRFLGGGLDEAKMVAVVDAALYRQRVASS